MSSRAQRRAQRRQRQAGAGAGAGATGAAAGGAAADPSFSQRARSRQAQVRPSQQQTRGQTGRKEVQRGSFVRESVAELRKVDWPDQKQVTTGSVVVVIACAIVGAYLWINDLIWQRVVEAIL